MPWCVLPKLGGPVLKKTDQENSKSTCSETTTEKHKPVPEGWIPGGTNHPSSLFPPTVGSPRYTGSSLGAGMAHSSSLCSQHNLDAAWPPGHYSAASYLFPSDLVLFWVAFLMTLSFSTFFERCPQHQLWKRKGCADLVLCGIQSTHH